MAVPKSVALFRAIASTVLVPQILAIIHTARARK